MIRMYLSKTARQAKDYFRDALSKADYYIESQEAKGTYNGKIAQRLGLAGKSIDKHSFDSLCDNLNPITEKSLTPRTLQDRRVAYDISFHCPKSVSIALCLSQDKNLKEAVDTSIFETMQEIETDMYVRVRSNGQNKDQHTGELLWCNFEHWTARAIEGYAPDPHYHWHCVVMNLTQCPIDNKFKAGQFYYIKKDMPYYQARFHKRLADKLGNLGFSIRKTKNSFELGIIPQKAIDHFSKRTNHIGQVAKEKNITHPKVLDQLGARTRAKKDISLSMSQLQEEWQEQIAKANIETDIREDYSTAYNTLTPDQSIEYALSHVFTNHSVKRDREILKEAYSYAIGDHSVNLNNIDKSLQDNDNVFSVRSDNHTYCTTALVHAQERLMITLARQGMETHIALNKSFDTKELYNLGSEQADALKYVLKSEDQVMMIRGGAGTGKTTLLKSIIPEIEKVNKQVFLFAPTAEASRGVLRKEGFAKADTVSRYLKDQNLQDRTQGQILWIDEAGLLGVEDMLSLLQLAKDKNTRLILSGDWKQHNAVKRGDAMRLLSEIGRLRYASLKTIYRQKSDAYKRAVQEISEGKVQLGFKRLEIMGCIQELEANQIDTALVADYIEARKNKKSVLVITPTRAKVKEINTSIRQSLINDGMIGKMENRFTVFDNLYLTNAQKSDPRNYTVGQVIQTHQNLKKIKRGDRLKIIDINNNTVIVEDQNGTNHVLPLGKGGRFDVYLSRSIALAKKDEIRVLKNGFDMKGKQLSNGNILCVKGFDHQGNIKVTKYTDRTQTDYILDKRHGNFDYAYCSTSYSAQGKTVDKVIISQPAMTFPASDQKQFYVSTSRAREDVTIYTDDKELLLEIIKKTGNRQSAIGLII